MLKNILIVLNFSRYKCSSIAFVLSIRLAALKIS